LITYNPLHKCEVATGSTPVELAMPKKIRSDCRGGKNVMSIPSTPPIREKELPTAEAKNLKSAFILQTLFTNMIMKCPFHCDWILIIPMIVY
jgi:hypothetical protein